MARLILTAFFVLTATVAAQESPTPQACEGFVIARGRVNAAAHEWQDGSFNLDTVTIVMPRGAVALLRAKDFDGKDAELVLRMIPQRTLETIR